MTWRLAAINKSFKETGPLLWGHERMNYKHERSTLAVRKDCEPLLVSWYLVCRQEREHDIESCRVDSISIAKTASLPRAQTHRDTPVLGRYK